MALPPRLPFYKQNPQLSPVQSLDSPMGGAVSIRNQGGAALGSARGAQGEALGMYRDAAMGNGPSVAEQQMKAGADQAVANQMAMQAQGRGGNLGANMRAAGQAGVGMQMQNNQQAAQLRAAEQQAAMQGFAGLGSTMADQGLQQQLAGQGFAGDIYGQQLASETQWGLGQRELDLKQREGNRAFGKDVSFGIFDRLSGLGGMGA